MSNSTKQFVFGSLVGILLGVPATHALNELLGISWWSVLIAWPVFGTVGYICYDIKEVFRCLKKATTEVFVRKFSRKSLWLLAHYSKNSFAISSGVAFRVSLVATGTFALILFVVCVSEPVSIWQGVVVCCDVLCLTMLFGLFVLFAFYLVSMFTFVFDFRGRYKVFNRILLENCAADEMNLLSDLVVCCKVVKFIFINAHYLLFVFTALGWLFKKVGKVFALTYRYIHSEERRAVFATVGLGMMIGFCIDLAYGSIILATFTGAMFGIPLGFFLHRVVAVRWLGIQPVEV